MLPQTTISRIILSADCARMRDQCYAQDMPATEQDAGQVFLKRDAFNRIMRAHHCESDSSCARMIGVNRSTIARLRAQIGSPSGAVMFQIAEALGVDIEVLFTRNQEES